MCPSLDWSDIEPPSSKTIDWHDIEPPSFAAGTLAGMKEYQGLSPEQATQKYLAGWGKTLDVIGEEIADPVGTATSAAKALAHDIHHPVETAERLGRWAYENPDEAFTQAIAMAVPGADELGAAGAASRLQRVGREVAGAETATVAAPEATAGSKAVGKGITEVKETAGPFPSETIQPVLSDIRNELKKHSYSADDHKAAATALGRMDELLGKKTGQTPESVSNIARKTLMSPGFASTPEGQNLIKRIQSQIGVEKSPLVGKTFNLHDVENAFDNIRRVAARTDKQSAMGHMMEEKLSDFVYKLPGGADYMQRRSTYAVAKRLETAQRIKQAAIDAGHATFTGAGVGHAFANEMKKIARLGPGGKPNKLLRLWTPEQQEFIKRVAGRRDVGERMARFFGKMSPTHWGGGVMDSLLALVLGPWTAGGAMVAGVAGRGTERLIARSKMKEFDRLILKPAEDDLERVVGTPALNSVRGSPALESWKKRATRATTRALAIEIARQANKPQLIPRIEQEINQIEPASNQ